MFLVSTMIEEESLKDWLNLETWSQISSGAMIEKKKKRKKKTYKQGKY